MLGSCCHLIVRERNHVLFILYTLYIHIYIHVHSRCPYYYNSSTKTPVAIRVYVCNTMYTTSNKKHGTWYRLHFFFLMGVRFALKSVYHDSRVSYFPVNLSLPFLLSVFLLRVLYSTRDSKGLPLTVVSTCRLWFVRAVECRAWGSVS